MNQPIDYFADVDTEATPPATLERLTEIAKACRELQGQIDEINMELMEKQDKLKKNLRDIIPSIMDELGMSKFVLTDGSTIDIKDVINASISEQNKPAAFAWLIEHKFDGIIKTNVHAGFGKGEREKAEAALKALVDAGYDAAMDESVHPMTLKSFVKERMEKGEEIPIALFGIFDFKEAKITLPKVKRPKGK